MTLKEYYLGTICLISPQYSPEFAWQQMEDVLENKFLEYLRLNKDSKEVLEALYESLTGKELSCLK
jgi:hypothetical protein